MKFDYEGLKRHERIRLIMLGRATYTMSNAVKLIEAIRPGEPADAAADIRAAVSQASQALMLAAEVAGYFDAMATLLAHAHNDPSN
jgi:hypothetical protein